MGIILVINAGSSSYKCALFADECIWSASMQWKENFKDAYLEIGNQTQTHLTHFFPSQSERGGQNAKSETKSNFIKLVEEHSEAGWPLQPLCEEKKMRKVSQIVNIKSAGEALLHILNALPTKEIDAIGHRVVHGGEQYYALTRIDEEVKRAIKKLFSLAPLHNPKDLEGIEIAEKTFPNIPHYAVFDTAFHHTIKEEVFTYPIPLHLRERGMRKYGFHGISHEYCSKKVKELSTKERVIVCHLGAGASLCAIDKGKSVDTTMGYSPLDGLMMVSRCGSIDPGLILDLLHNHTSEQINHMLNNESGLLGISGISEDMRDILKQAHSGSLRAQLSLDMFQHRLAGYIAMMAASLGGLDTLVFTAGIGENAPFVRQDACERLSFLGIAIDHRENNLTSSSPRIISSPLSKVTVCIIPTQEEFEIASQIKNAL